MDATLLILGLGGVGAHLAHLAVHMPGVRIVVGDIRAEHAAQVGASIISEAFFLEDYRRFPEVDSLGIDLMNAEAIGDMLDKYRPDVIFNATTLLSWWHLHRLPHEVARKIYYGFPEGTGLRPWAPGHGAPLANLMRLVKKHYPQIRVVNVSGPDYLHEILGKTGLAPDVGVGNVALLEPILKRITAKKFGLRPEMISVALVGHHCMCMQIFQEGTLSPEIPFYLRIKAGDKDITEEIDIQKDLWAKVPQYMPLLSRSNQQCVAASALQIIRGILFDSGSLAHAPGPEGLPGGCPVRLDASGARIAPPEGLSREEMIEIMYAANRHEGFEKTTEDGMAAATPECKKLVEEIFGMEWKYSVFTADNMLQAHQEMAAAFARLLEKYGIDSQSQ